MKGIYEGIGSAIDEGTRASDERGPKEGHPTEESPKERFPKKGHPTKGRQGNGRGGDLSRKAGGAKHVLLPIVIVVAVLCGLLALMLACSQPEQKASLVNVFLDKDSQPPVLLSVSSVASSIVRIDFDEQVRVYGDSFEPFVARADGKSVFVTLDSSLRAGEKASLKGRVQDYSGNTTGFSVGVWGYNPSIPDLVINEFTTKRDTRNPDRTELFAVTGGNLAGVTLYCGTPNDYDAKFMFPDCEVGKGDYIVVWWVKDDYPENLMDSAGHDFSAKSNKTPSDNNGVLVLADSPSPGAAIMDAVVYSDFGESADGFGTAKARDRAVWVVSSGAWQGDAIDSTNSTATRSMARRKPNSSDAVLDFDTRADWYVTCTKGATFGAPNTSEPYSPY